MREDDPHNLQRFLAAQDNDYESVIRELRRGRKKSHWIWYIFPQVAGLGSSSIAEHYAIGSKDEALAYLEHPVLGKRLCDCCEALLQHSESKIEEIMGYPDDLKLRSSMTLFASVSADPKLFLAIIDMFYNGITDDKTIAFLKSKGLH